MQNLFFRCNSGHYFQDPICPWDGWSHPGFDKAFRISKEIIKENKAITLNELKHRGIDNEVLKRIILIEFGDQNAEFEAIYPKQLVVNGEIYDLIDLDNYQK